MSRTRRTTGEYWLTHRPDSPVWYLATYDTIKRKGIHIFLRCFGHC